MLKSSLRTLCPLAVLALLSAPAQADPSSVLFSGGWHDMAGQDETSEFGAEYRGDGFYGDLGPTVGATVTADGALYGYAGLYYPYHVTDKFMLTVETAVGAYEQGDGKDLGGTVEFRSGLEAAYVLSNQNRIGVEITHMSNASIYAKNPGVNAAIITLAFPY
ncbi:MAG: acyloxyacyl hydrolase [Alphaproteobacteria bacterium]|nr:acyloxyacyl hydrolase [Alphaproteobacteria bacterium]